MATATCQLSEDQFLCSICLDVFTDPVTLPCGHNFCKHCIDQYWSSDATCKCPNCNHVYDTKPDVKVNVFISEMAAQFRESQTSATGQPASNAEEIFCDLCADSKMKAVKSCLDCLASYCKSHLKPHLEMAILKRHILVKPQKFLENRVEERPDAGIQEMIALRQHKIKQLYQFMERNKKDADVEMARVDMDNKARGYIIELMREISELKKGNKTTKDWSNFSICPPAYEGTAVRAMANLEEKLGRRMSTAFLVELQRVQKDKVDVMLDPDKVHHKSANPSNTKSSSESKTECMCVLASQTFSSGKYYFEVDVRSRSKWALGLAKELHVNKEVALIPQNAYWVICMRDRNEWYAGSEPSMRLSLKSKPEKVGVFVDYEEGLVSFYDANKAVILYTFTGCNFTQKVHPFFSPCANNGVQLHSTPESSCALQ